ncbi:MAG: helix-turn-helix domain-containing protein [Tissierellia bacterium]|nr:helix-turn-helix domain-containing protein [Tissierellia bacterium]
MLLNEILKNNKLNYLKPLTNKSSLFKEIISVESTETPDAHKYILKHSIVITTAMMFKEDQNRLIHFIDNLNENQATGLAIKVGRFLKTLDKKVIEHCNDLNFPLLLIPDDKTLGNVYHDFLRQLWDYEQDGLTYALNSQRIFSSMLLKKPDLQIILDTLNSILDVEVALVNSFAEFTAYTHNFHFLFKKKSLANLLKKYKKIDKPYICDIIEISNGKKQEINFHKILFGTNYCYYLIIQNSEKLDKKISKFIIDQAIFAISFTITLKLNNEHFELQKKERALDNFLVLAKKGKEKEWMEITNDLIIHPFYSGIHIIIHFPEFNKFFPEHLQQEGYTLLYNWLREKFIKLENFNIIPLTFYKYYLIQSSNQDVDYLIKTISKILKNIKMFIGLESNITIGPKYFSYKGMRESITETINAVKYGKIHPKFKNVKLTRAQNYKKLFTLISNNQKEFFYETTLKKLSEDSPQKAELRETLRVWLFNQTNMQQTAKQLYLHRNTVNYRIEKCKDILESDLKDPLELFNLEIALNLSIED